MNLSEEFWDSRYINKDTGWDLGEISPPLKSYFDQLTNRNLKILIPGGGNSYEAEYLNQQGFQHVYVVDLSKTALNNIKRRVPSFPSSNLLHQNFFDLEMNFDLIIEQTFFCALDPKLRPSYTEKAAELLYKRGKIVGLLFNVPLNTDKPPFGGNKKEYLDHFEPHFEILSMEPAYNSHSKRLGRELFIIAKKKN
ncbi:methyltransferase domain-containing protein [Gelidibacter sp.]|uniref:methyltransferase domain-containing protein n=1 Tax=Gelidibacter sp. TaxID=2018083 RepID=UPI002CBA4FCE|nr:methyltransferase domain-containing protein [Gelidibacter sp.]HUH29223.1 methyltransferase domain-containing protein [Gelidibacter sp.]